MILGALAVPSSIAMAQNNPFGSRNPTQAGAGVNWIVEQQAVFYRALSSAIHQTKADGSAIWALAGISLLYGIFHAAGPGHGKAIVSSYLLANRETWRRGVVLSLASSLLQALTAVLIVSIGAVLIGATGKAMGNAVRAIEIFSFGLIMLLGARLAWSKGTGLLYTYRALRRRNRAAANSLSAGECACEPAAGARFMCDVVQPHDAACHSGSSDVLPWGHAHAPEPQRLAGEGGWRRGLSAVIAVGIRPCSGAILVLVFALSQGIFWAGIASTFMMGLGTAFTVGGIATIALGAQGLARRVANHREGFGVLVLRGIEFVAALTIFCFGGLFLMGYLASERLVGF